MQKYMRLKYEPSRVGTTKTMIRDERREVLGQTRKVGKCSDSEWQQERGPSKKAEKGWTMVEKWWRKVEKGFEPAGGPWGRGGRE